METLNMIGDWLIEADRWVDVVTAFFGICAFVYVIVKYLGKNLQRPRIVDFGAHDNFPFRDEGVEPRMMKNPSDDPLDGELGLANAEHGEADPPEWVWKKIDSAHQAMSKALRWGGPHTGKTVGRGGQHLQLRVGASGFRETSGPMGNGKDYSLQCIGKPGTSDGWRGGGSSPDGRDHHRQDDLGTIRHRKECGCSREGRKLSGKCLGNSSNLVRRRTRGQGSP